MIDVERNARLCIHTHYRHRPKPTHFDDRDMRDEWQDGVYRRARDLAVKEGFRSIVDFGCGSGFKLMKYFSGYETVGYELEPSLSHARTLWPRRDWLEVPAYAFNPGAFAGDMLICADVLEHMPHPETLLHALKYAPLQMVILSTPALEILAERGETPRLGPPNNESHVNEWTTREFRDFCNMHLKVVDHLVVDATQGTQMVVAKPH